MNGRTVLYWMVTALMAALMLMASIPDITKSETAVAAFLHLGYPVYLLPFIGVAKIAGVIAVLLPSPRSLKEWAYAGLVFDLTGALYSHLSVGDPAATWMFAVIGLILVTGSYLLLEDRTPRGLRSHGWTAAADSGSPGDDAGVGGPFFCYRPRPSHSPEWGVGIVGPMFTREYDSSTEYLRGRQRPRRMLWPAFEAPS